MITDTLLTGSAVAECLDDLASLRITIFREYPYLYDGLRKDELTYLRHYMETPEALVISVKDSGKMIGAATGMPLRYENESLVAPFSSTPYSVDDLYYVGEILFSPTYRDNGRGLRLLNQIEEYVSTLETYRFLTCATIVRPDNHSLRPENYIPIDRFLARTGFSMLPDVTTNFTWLETDGVSRDHEMQFWLKEL
ncbi:MAG: GNAT family N-acetyltransferase [Desulfuromonadaceae bacterium]|nr:GNAT family N-acetyltransferase [Desulfuromonadaceae bacterium]